MTYSPTPSTSACAIASRWPSGDHEGPLTTFSARRRGSAPSAPTTYSSRPTSVTVGKAPTLSSRYRTTARCRPSGDQAGGWCSTAKSSSSTGRISVPSAARIHSRGAGIAKAVGHLGIGHVRNALPIRRPGRIEIHGPVRREPLHAPVIEGDPDQFEPEAIGSHLGAIRLGKHPRRVPTAHVHQVAPVRRHGERGRRGTVWALRRPVRRRGGTNQPEPQSVRRDAVQVPAICEIHRRAVRTPRVIVVSRSPRETHPHACYKYFWAGLFHYFHDIRVIRNLGVTPNQKPYPKYQHPDDPRQSPCMTPADPLNHHVRFNTFTASDTARTAP